MTIPARPLTALKRTSSWPPRSLVGIAAVALLARLILIPAAPVFSDDIYRYGWDGRVQAAGISPYPYPPAAPQLETYCAFLGPNCGGQSTGHGLIGFVRRYPHQAGDFGRDRRLFER